MVVPCAYPLDTLLQRAIMDPSAEPALLRALFGVTLFMHRPVSEGHDRLRVVQFTRPDGAGVIPAFHGRRKGACRCTGARRRLGMKCRVLLRPRVVRRARVNPNDTSCTLNPEEIADLLDGRRISRAGGVTRRRRGDRAGSTRGSLNRSTYQRSAAIRTTFPRAAARPAVSVALAVDPQ